MSDKLLSPKNDIVFQELFGKPKNSEITKHLISLILEKEIFNIELDVNKRMLGDRKDSKIGRLDIRAKFNNGEDCDIELQVAPYPNIEKRILSYWAMMYQSKIERGKDYKELNPSICILIADYKIKTLVNMPEYHTVWNLRERKYKNKILSKDIEIHILEIPKIKENEILKDELALWLKFIENPKNEEVEKNMSMYEGGFFKQAREELAYLSDDPYFHELVQDRVLYLLDQNSLKNQAREEGLEEGKEQGIKQGIKEGRKKGRAEGRAEGKAEGRKEGKKEGKKEEKIEIAKKLLKLKMPIEQIIEITELAQEEINNLIEQKE